MSWEGDFPVASGFPAARDFGADPAVAVDVPGLSARDADFVFDFGRVVPRALPAGALTLMIASFTRIPSRVF